MILIDGKKLSKEVLADLTQKIADLPFVPVFCDVLVGDDFASKKYVSMKSRIAGEIGMRFHEAFFQASISTESLITEIQKINSLPDMCGVIVQLPLPSHIDEQKVLDAIDPKLDVDVLGSEMSSKFYTSESPLSLPTALACMHILDSLNLDLLNKNIVVLGQGKLVGRPVARLLEKRGITPLTIDSDTPNQLSLLQQADIIISGIGKANYLKADMVKEHVIIIDAGTSESNAGLSGDVDQASVSSKALYLSPCPGGVGPVTVAMLFKNVLQVAQNITEEKSDA